MTQSHQEPTDTSLDAHGLSRRDVFSLVGAAALAALVVPEVASAHHDPGDNNDNNDDDGESAPSRFVYVAEPNAGGPPGGGGGGSTANGVYAFKMDGDTGGLTQIQFVGTNPSWLTVDATAAHLYSTSDTLAGAPPTTGGARAFAIDASTGLITRINDQPTMGKMPAHVAVDPSGKFALVANLFGPNWSVLPIRADGSLNPATDVFGVSGHGPDPFRQEAPHPHQSVFDPAGKYVFGPDLGTDNVWSWTLNTTTGKLVPNANLDHAQVASGSGPRHLSFHPSGKFVYVIDELASSITAFNYDAARGIFTWLQTVSTIPSDFTATNTTSEIIVHHSGKFLYGGNRGHNSVVEFRIDQTTGKLSRVGFTFAQGAIPRVFDIDPSGKMMLVGYQTPNSVTTFRINQSSGKLHATGAVTSTPLPPASFAFGRIIS